MEGGCIPLLSKESGVDYYPLEEYERGNTEIYEKAHIMNNKRFRELQLEGQDILDTKYNNDVFKQQVRKVIKELMEK